MDPITLIVTALTAGASAETADILNRDARPVAKAAYVKLHSLARKRVIGNPGAEVALAEFEADPETWQAPLAKKLAQLGAADDTELVAAAAALMDFVDRAGAGAGKYNVTVKDSQGVQVGDGGMQINRF